ncbi:unnamed protein product [Angiostrongylus costaricensis]|uniref:Prolyl endopeptidase n=1 Tax=Angiostrongylus costaricensis TaxID=334426 RepID=A0A0R3PHR0_ANGCS|nr:unnamed protein product [Angiostrongylus costaricensis]
MKTSTPIQISPTTYPVARYDETVVDNFHGTKVFDPYRWMEDPDALETRKFVDELNAISEPVIYQQKTLSDKGDIFLDPNTPDGTTSIRISEWTNDGSILAYGLSEKGSDWVTVKVKLRQYSFKYLCFVVFRFRGADKKDLSDVIEGVKHSSLSWLKDNSGLFYCKYPEHKTVHEGTSVEKHKYHSLYFHRMGTHCMEDVLVYDRRDNADYMIGGTVTDDGRFLIIDVSRGCDMYNMLYYYDLSNFNGSYVDHDDNSMLIHTNYNAPMFKLIRMSLNDGSTREVVPENPHHMLHWAVPVAGDRLVLCYIEDVKNTLYVHNLNSGTLLCPIPLKIGSVSGFFGRKTLHDVFFSYESFTVPTIVYHVDFASVDRKSAPKVKELRRVNVKGMDEDQFSVEQVFFESKDKTKVPMYILSLKDASRDGTTPTILNGYGGFNVSDMPYFSISRLFFVRHFGGVIACANLRGGSEYGENWHMSGMRENKQNVFDDFISAAEYLISHEYTCSKKLAIHGGSNGGLLVAACSQQRPELYGAVLNRVGVMDMLRFHKFTIGGAWIPEYGNPDVAEDFKFIYKYSPLHNIRFPDQGQWPSTLMMTADHDDRVVPCHTLKYVATLYEKAKHHTMQNNPLLVRVEVNAGHGAGKPTTKLIAEIVDMYSFLQRVMDIEWKD